MSSRALVFQHTLHYVLGLLNALANLAFVLNVGFGREGLMDIHGPCRAVLMRGC